MSIPLFYLKEAELSFGGKPLFSGISFQVSAEDKVCLVGRNGSGKSTIMKIIAGLIELDKGELFIKPGLRVGYLPQNIDLQDYDTIYDYVLEEVRLAEGENKEGKKYLADMVLSRLDLSGETSTSNLSGGQLRRTALAKALIIEPEILLLDEPTNHLDIAAIEWLESYIINYKGALMCISHDRAFLNNISNKTFWLDRGGLLISNKGFKHFEEWSNFVYEQEENELHKLNKKLEAENHWLAYGVTARRKRNQGRLRDLHSLRARIKDEKSNVNTRASFVKLPPLSDGMKAKMVVEMDQVSHNFPGRSELIKNFSIRIIKGEKIGIVGKNGAGKTTFLKLITGQLSPNKGNIRLGVNLNITYFDQKRESLDPNETLWSTLCPDGGDMVSVGGNQRHVVAYLKDFMFDSKQAKSPVSSLSGGEANRLLLAKKLANPGNFLILDEPTNDLDMDTLDMLQDYLSEYNGTLIIVSHDRDFLDRIVTRTLVFNGEGKIVDCVGGYSDYIREAKEEEKKIQKASSEQKEIKEKEPKKLTKLSYKDQRELDLLPDKIDSLNQEIKQIEEMLVDSSLYTKDPAKYNELSVNLNSKREVVEAAEMRWLELLEMVENLK
jgi:ATP-binding cassette subfamily F protein uup